MLKIGLTGGIGSGKSTVAKVFEVLGIPVYYADDAAKWLMNNDASIKTKLVEIFGQQCYSNGILNKSVLSTLIFNNPENTAIINSIVHPVTIADADIWMQKQKSAYAIKEAALIFEANAQKHLDYVIGVSSPLALRIKRVMQRDNIDEKAALARMQKQMNEDEKIKLCDFVIQNNETDLLIPQVLEIHNQILKLS